MATHGRVTPPTVDDILTLEAMTPAALDLFVSAALCAAAYALEAGRLAESRAWDEWAAEAQLVGMARQAVAVRERMLAAELRAGIVTPIRATA